MAQFAEAHIKALNEISVADNTFIFGTNKEKNSNLNSKYPYTKISDSLAEMVLKVDSVIIATPNHTHFDVFKEINCIKKMPILCEKPLTIDNDQASIFEKEAHHLSIVGFNYRHNPVISFLVEYIKNNDLG